MDILQKTQCVRHARFKYWSSNIQLALKRSMDKQETLGLDNLALEKLAAPRNANRANKRRDKSAKEEASVQSDLLKASGQHTPSISSGNLPMLKSYQPSPIAPLGSSAGALDQWSWRDHHDRSTQISSELPEHAPTQIDSSSEPPTLSKYHQGFNKPSIFPRVTGVPYVQHRLSSGGSQLSTQNSSSSVLKFCDLPSSRIDNQHRYLKANPQLTEATTVHRGRWTGSPPANLQKSLSYPSRSSHSTETRDLQITLPTPRKSSPSITDSNDDLIYLPAPKPTSAYVDDANATPNLLPSPQRLLLVLDLNGTLLHRSRASQKYTSRPGLPEFLKYAFANHCLFIWSSAQPHNVKGVCSRLFSRDQREMLLGEWGRNTLGLTSSQYKERVQVYKRLDRIWGDEVLQRLHPDFEKGERWNQNNTMLIDDSALKASAQPFNHVEVPEFVRGGGEKEEDGRDVLGQVVEYLEEARKWSNVSGFVRQKPFKMDWAAGACRVVE